jgi:hypothetical protein
MIDINNSEGTDDQDEGSSLAPWQQFLRRWQGPIAFGPFVLVIFVVESPISRAHPHWMDFLPAWTILPILVLPVIWAVFVVGYALYLKYLE